ncbi:hypothetical protein BDR03DRAFT_929338 [Suillus americanus]|nr:hypothetical protein BDR03DRAFT_929338 [Suillus americanus]
MYVYDWSLRAGPDPYSLSQDTSVGRVRESHSNTIFDAEQGTASIDIMHLTRSKSKAVQSGRGQSTLTAMVNTATVSSLSLAGPLNVLLFGETGVGKSAIINLIMGRDVAQTSPDATSCTLQHTSYEVSLGDHRFKLWEISSLESMSFFQTLFTKWRLKKAYKKLYKDDGVYLLLYCMRGSRPQRALLRDYKFFTDVVGSTAGPGRVPVAAVVTSLEDYLTDMDMWWVKNKDSLESLGMRFSAHACITSLPDDPHASPAMRARRHRSEQVIRRLIYDSYHTETPRSSSPALTL